MKQRLRRSARGLRCNNEIQALRWRFRDARIGVDVMPTGPAVRTYNILFGEGRRVGAALIAVE